tara:strand:+ start:938 stop:1069 length:132 start_codon:yes stop_codon:yes gene_type:complete
MRNKKEKHIKKSSRKQSIFTSKIRCYSELKRQFRKSKNGKYFL